MPIRIAKIKATTLKIPLTGDSTSIQLKKFVTHKDEELTIDDFGGLVVLAIKQGDQLEMAICDSLSYADDGTATLEFATNGRHLDGQYPYTGSNTGLAFSVGAEVIVGDDPKTVYEITEAYTNSVSIAGAPNASQTVKGIVEIATAAQIDSDSATGETGAVLAISPDQLPTSKYGTRLPSADQKAALAGGGNFGTPSTSNKFLTEAYNASATGLPVVRTYLNAASPATWTKPAGLKYVVVEVQAIGGEGSGVTSTDAGGGGAGAGGYGKKTIPAASLGATETVTIGAIGNPSSFGSHVTANQGANGTSNDPTPGAGGTASGGDINIPGQSGQKGRSSNWGGKGGDSVLGRGGPMTVPGNNGESGSGYGGGGGGGVASGTGDQGGGSPSPAIVIVTEYYS